jgi:hypothetical protein
MELQAFLDERLGPVESSFGPTLMAESESLQAGRDWMENREGIAQR